MSDQYYRNEKVKLKVDFCEMRSTPLAYAVYQNGKFFFIPRTLCTRMTKNPKIKGEITQVAEIELPQWKVDDLEKIGYKTVEI